MVQPNFDPERFARRVGSWLQQEGRDADVVISCRARLARNVEGYPFVSRLEEDQAKELSERLHPLLEAQRLAGETVWVEIPEATTVVRLLLRERHLVSRDLAPSDPRRSVGRGRAVAFGADESISVMVNEEDHLRLQGLSSGLALDEAWKRVRDLDRALESEVGFAHSERLGYLTGCPTNVGTGLRASVMMHLPALGLVRSELEKVFTAAQRTGLAVRGMYGEGSRAAGDFYQISNQVTLGRSEEQLVDDLLELVPCIVDFERRVRDALAGERRAAIEDRVRRSLGMLKTSRSMTTEGALHHLSTIRLGACLGIVEDLTPHDLYAVAIQIQRGHLQVLAGESGDGADLLEPSARDRLRASWLRRRFASHVQEPPSE